MVERKEVEALLAEVHSMAEINQVAVGDIAHPVEGDTLDALCRAWLAVEEAEVGRRYAHAEDDWIVTPDEDGGVAVPYQRVRIVPVEGEEAKT